MSDDLAPPDGIEPGHERAQGGWHRHASPVSLILLGVVLVMGLSGALGRERDWETSRSGVDLRVHAPEIVRNGEFLEMRIRIVSESRIEELVIGVDASLWQDMTVNTMVPAATDERGESGEFRFTFAALEPGTEFLWKVDLQVNPDILAGTAGSVTAYDGEEALVGTELAITVLP